MASIEIRGVDKSFGATQVLHDVDLEVADGEFLVLVGPSGCGKSTLLRLIAGLEEVSGGEIVDRRSRGERPAAEGSRHRDGVPELRALSAHDGAREHGLQPQAAQGVQGDGREEGGGRGGNAQSRALSRPLSAPALRRPAPARGDGPRDRARPAGVPVRRAAVQSRRQAAGADAGRDQVAPSAPARDVGLRHARPDRSDDDGRPDRRAAGRAGRADRHAAGTLRPSGQSLRRRLHRLAGDEFRPRPPAPTATMPSGSKRATARGCRAAGTTTDRRARRSSTASGPSSSRSVPPARASRPGSW